MKQRILCTLLCFLILNSLFAGRVIPDFDSLDGRLVKLYRGDKSIGVYGLSQATDENRCARTALNLRVDTFIETGVQYDGRLEMLVVGPDGRNEFAPPRRSTLMFIRLKDLYWNIRSWWNEEFFNPQQHYVVEDSLTDEIMFVIMEQLNSFDQVLKQEEPFGRLLRCGFFAKDDDFSDEDYRLMHDFFNQYIHFIEGVLFPWKHAWNHQRDADSFLQTPFWTRKLKGMIAFRFYVQGRIYLAGITKETAASFLEEANTRINAINESPLHALIAMVIMNAQVNDMHGVWLDLRNAFNKNGFAGMPYYTEVIQGQVLRRLELLNALLVTEEILPFNGRQQNRWTFNTHVLSLYRMLLNHMTVLFRYAGESPHHEDDGVELQRSGALIDAFIREHFPSIEPLEFEEPDGSESDSEEIEYGSDADGGYLPGEDAELDVINGEREEAYSSGEDAEFLEIHGLRYFNAAGRDTIDLEYTDDVREIDFSDEDVDTVSPVDGGSNATDADGTYDTPSLLSVDAARSAVALYALQYYQGHGGCG